MSENHLFAGVDDGNRETKIVLSNGLRISTPSRAMSGLSNQISLNGAKSGVFSYLTQDGPFSVGNIEAAEDTAYDGYPTSAQNRVIVAHALRQLGLNQSHTLDIVTGLPLKRFYLNGDLNKDLIGRKKKNLKIYDVKGVDGYAPAVIKRHDVLSEAIAGWVNYVIQRNPEGKLSIVKDRALERTAIIDIGGRTLDIAVVKDWVLDRDRSTTDEIGMIKIVTALKERLYDFFNGVDLTDEQVEQALTTRQVKVKGKLHVVGEIVDSATMSVLNSIKATVMRQLQKSGDIDTVFFIGGTSEFLRPHLADWFEQQVLLEDAAFANAEGMLKYAEFAMGQK
ncbi:ParM/StbA family protein [Pseudomonas taiwanensis]|uniref:ParM/StbA family protein n=1 Tax=Pseudomonas taiwanensis TaxID=470150 RepID=UPI0028DF1E18|nr:ParM/StbA family protein [Pseudomonas taiwanensis]MDT8924904.1 ParM/StbA family protein [Pseudomonas taiwanensis]